MTASSSSEVGFFCSTFKRSRFGLDEEPNGPGAPFCCLGRRRSSCPHDAPRMPEGRRPRRCLDNRSKSVFVIASQLFCHFEHQFMPALITTARAAEWRTVHGAARAESKRSFRSGRVKRPRGKA